MNFDFENPASRQVRSAMELVMGPFPSQKQRVAPDLQILEEERLAGCTRQLISFAVEPGDRLPAYLLMPHEPLPGTPAVLCLHQTVVLGKAEPAGVGGDPNFHYALHLAERGYITLAPDYSLFPPCPVHGVYTADPYAMGYTSSTMKGIWNHMRAIDVLEALPEVDSSRIGCIGHSLGGHNAIFLAAFDERVRVTISSCGFTSFAKYKGGDLSGWSHPGYMPRIADVYDNDAAKMPFDFSDVIASLAPRPFFANAPIGDSFDFTGVQESLSIAGEVYSAYGAPEAVRATYPKCGHDFPTAAREEAYAWLDRWL